MGDSVDLGVIVDVEIWAWKEGRRMKDNVIPSKKKIDYEKQLEFRGS